MQKTTAFLLLTFLIASSTAIKSNNMMKTAQNGLPSIEFGLLDHSQRGGGHPPIEGDEVPPPKPEGDGTEGGDDMGPVPDEVTEEVALPDCEGEDCGPAEGEELPPVNENGTVPEGDVPEGDVPEGDVPEGDVLEGDAPEGVAPEGDAPEGDAPEGDAPEGDGPPPCPEGQECNGPPADGEPQPTEAAQRGPGGDDTEEELPPQGPTIE